MPFDIPAQTLALALLAFAKTTGDDLLVPSALLAGRVSHAVHGRYAPEDALRELLRGTGCAGALQDNAILIRCAPAPVPEADS